MSAETVLKLECLESSPTYGRFIVEPLEPGEGITLGNALRRVLLSSLPGAAVTWIHIDGVQHEFSVIDSAKEDTLEFALNVKGLRMRSLSGRPGKLFLEVDGEGKITAADIAPSADFEIINPERYLATLNSPEAKLRVELNVELGKGFTAAGPLEGQPIGIIPVDAIFSPVRKVNYSVEPASVGQETSWERLNLEVWTDGSISPSEAMTMSAQILSSRFSLLPQLIKPTEIPEGKPSLQPTLSPEQHNMPLEKLEFSVRTFNCLKRGGLNTLGELLQKSEEELMALRHFGEKSRHEVEEKLQLMGYVLRIKEAASEVKPQPDVEEAAPDIVSEGKG